MTFVRRILVSLVLGFSAVALAQEKSATVVPSSEPLETFMQAVFSADLLAKITAKSQMPHLSREVELRTRPSTDRAALLEKFSARLTGRDATLQVPPEYPPEFRKEGVQANVTVYAVIASDGSVGDIHVWSVADPAFRRAAALAVKQWRFPMRESEALAVVPVVFKFDSAGREGLAPSNPELMPALREELLERRERDQAIRNELIKSGAERPDPEIAARMRAIDHENTVRMKEIVREHGWPGPELVGRDGTQAAWLLVQHSTHGFQKEMLPLVHEAYLAKKIPGANYALLLDRVLVGEGKPQRYGSQGKWENGVLGLQPIEDEANVDQRRAEVGLGPLADYLAGLRATYQPKDATKK